MKSSLLRSAVMTAILSAVFVVAANAQTEPMTGGYSNISVTSAEATSAAAVAVKRHASLHTKDKVTLVRILKAEQQVVAGMNYRICMIVKNRRGVLRTVTAVVYQPLKGKKRSTDWQTGECKEI